MSNTTPILDYAARRQSPRELTIEESDGELRVLFPALPEWASTSGIGTALFLAIVSTIIPCIMFRQFWLLPYRMGPAVSAKFIQGMHQLAIRNALYGLPATLVLWIFAMSQLRKYRRWGLRPRIMTVKKDEVRLSYLGLWRMQERRSPAREITRIELRRIPGNLSRRSVLFSLVMHFENGRARRFRLTSRDPNLPDQIAERIRALLMCA